MDKKQRLQKLFTNPDIQWIRERLRERVRQGKGFDGKISLASPTGSQMAAFADLTGRRSRNRKRLSLPLQELESILHEAELADDLEEAVFLLEGSVANEKQRREGLRQEWQTLFERARSESEKSPKVIQWLEMLERSGLLKRLSLSDLQNAQQLLDQAFALHARLPAQQVELPALAAQITGDSHALDYGKPLAGVILPLLASLHDIDHWQNPADRRKVWDANGILCDSLSNPVLVCNLRLTASHPLAPILETNYQHEEPSYLTLTETLESALAGRRLYPLPRRLRLARPENRKIRHRNLWSEAVADGRYVVSGRSRRHSAQRQTCGVPLGYQFEGSDACTRDSCLRGAGGQIATGRP